MRALSVSPCSREPDSASVVLGAYDLRKRERSRQTFSVISVSENGYDPNEHFNDLLLLQVQGTPGTGRVRNWGGGPLWGTWEWVGWRLGAQGGLWRLDWHWEAGCLGVLG